MYHPETELNALMHKIHLERGLDVSQYKLSFVQRRIATRLRARGVSSYRAYMRLLDEEEYAHLLDSLTINLTSFFRDTTTFVALRDEVLYPLLHVREQEGRRRLDVWSAGCASGEEPYSMAILLHQLLGRRLSKWQIRILGTDIDDERLTQARRGLYKAFSFRGTQWPDLDHYFTPEPDGRRISAHIQKMVQFRHHDLISEQPPGRFDVILCRNVLIYLQREQQIRILGKFHRALKSGGTLILGKTEILPPAVSPLFRPFNMREHIYVKRKET